MNHCLRVASVFFCCGLFCISSACDDEQPAFSADQIDVFEKEVVGILEANCLKCHGGATPKGGLDLTSREGILKGGES